MNKNNLYEIYYGIENLLNELSSFDSYSTYQETLGKLDNGIAELYKYFGVRKLKMDVGCLKAGEVVQIKQDEGGIWLTPLKEDGYNTMMVDLYDYMDVPPTDMFYEY